MVIVLFLALLGNVTCNIWLKEERGSQEHAKALGAIDIDSDEYKVAYLQKENERLRQENADLAIKLHRQEYR